MRAAIVSDLHIGITQDGPDAARGGETLERLVDAVCAADTVILLGDIVELREGPLAQVLEAARPLFERLGAAAAGRRVVLVPGNHDHELAEPWLARARLEGRPLAPRAEWPIEPGDGPAGRLLEWMPDVELVAAYPGTWVRDDVYVTHGHYLDVHLTVPRLESIAAAVVARQSDRNREYLAPDDYEAVLAPLYSLFYRFAQGTGPDLLRRRSDVSRRLWNSVNGGNSSRLARFALGRVTIPGAVAILNRAGLGPFGSRLTGEALRRAGLEAMGTVADCLAPDAAHVVFGHTHRPGPLPRDDATEWHTPSGSRLWNSGTWFVETVLLGGAGPEHPYWPGTVIYVPEQGDLEVTNVLLDAKVPMPAR